MCGTGSGVLLLGLLMGSSVALPFQMLKGAPIKNESRGPNILEDVAKLSPTLL